ncbi:MAG TPA: glycosyltransferase family protein [Rhizomicrobium sp.]
MIANAPTVAVIQARMSSSRLPGKVLMPVAGKPLLWHLVHRLKQCRTVDVVAIATSVDARDDAIEQFCAAEGLVCVRGSLDNVLDRYRLAAEVTCARTLLRVTGDSPLIDPGFIDYLVEGFTEGRGDFVQLAVGARCAHEGVDVFSRTALDWLTKNAADDPVAREHVTSYFKLHPQAVKTGVVPEYAPLAQDHVRLSVDTIDDLAFIRAVHERLNAQPGELALTDVLQLLRDEPRYRSINAHVRQKPMTQRERHALVCCSGDTLQHGLSLARTLRDVQGFGVLFAAPAGAADAIRTEGFEVRSNAAPAALAMERKFDLIVMGARDCLSDAERKALAGIPVVAAIENGARQPVNSVSPTLPAIHMASRVPGRRLRTARSVNSA